MADPVVALFFPPLVESSFGRYFPSTAVLAGWLGKNGIESTQIDLNAEFAEYLLDSDALLDLAAGKVPGIAPEELAAACARWARANRQQLIADDGTFLFGSGSPFGYVMEELAKPFILDPEPDLLFADEQAANAWSLPWHRRFMATRPWADLVPSSVRIAGISVPMGPQLVPALMMAEELRSAGFDGRIVLGGPALSLMADADLEKLLTAHPAVDVVVRFDGEQPLLALATQAASGRWAPESVAGCSYLGQTGLRVVPPAPGLAMSALPAPEYEPRIVRRLSRPVFSVTQARGCYWGKCDYCDFVELYDGSPPYRGRPPAAVVAEMAELNARHGATEFTLVTESIPPAFARRMSTMLIEQGRNFRWDSFAMVDRRFDSELLNLMVRAGCIALVIGMETMTTRVLNLVHKSADREENIRFLREARQAGIKLSVNLIPDLPSTTYAEALESLETVSRYRDCIDSISVFPFEATRSSRVGRAPERFGLTRTDGYAVNGQAQYALNNAGLDDPAMTPTERVEIHDLYYAFAKELNKRQTAGTDDARTAAAPAHDGHAGHTAAHDDQELRMAIESFDWHLTPERIVVTNMASREVVSIPRRVDSLVNEFLDGKSFTAQAFHSHTGFGDRSEQLLSNLLSARLVVPARHPAEVMV